jgi:8-oxo-dGTP pyrophosphatase MutT (NUDIX family)
MTMAEHSSSISFAEHRKAFHNALPESRLGQQHDCLEAFQEATVNHHQPVRQQKEYSLVVVTEQPRRILLGMKNRGFGKGMYNSFGGKRERGESFVQGACRELEEETGIVVDTNRMASSQLGVLHVTFQDNSVEMVVHVFRIEVTTTTNASEAASALPLDPLTIRGCEEITPHWFEDFHHMPLDNMFADDSIWVCYTLETNQKVDGWFHFLAGGQETNTILQYYVKTTPDKVPEQPSSSSENPGAAPSSSLPVSLERRLFHALHDKSIQSLSIKEFNEAYAFMNALRIGKTEIDIVIDVAGGHGALAALFLVTTSAVQATVVDPAQVGNVQRVWGNFFPGKTLRYRHECLRTGLPAELKAALQSTCRTRILVVACHACQHLSDETVEIACQHGVNVAVMPCCQKDTRERSWKDTSKNIQVPIAKVMDILLAGKVMSWTSGQQAGVEYDVRMKVIDEKITPQNRIILCRSRLISSRKNEVKEHAHRKLQLAYKRAHVDASKPHREETGLPALSIASGCFLVVAGFTLGVVCSVSFFKKRR